MGKRGPHVWAIIFALLFALLIQPFSAIPAFADEESQEFYESGQQTVEPGDEQQPANEEDSNSETGHEAEQDPLETAPQVSEAPIDVSSLESEFTVNASGTITAYTGPAAADNGVVVIPESVNGTTVTGIGSNAFRNNTDIKKITIPAAVKTVAGTSSSNGAFTRCSNLEEVVFLPAAPGDDVAPNLGQYTFYGLTKLTSVTLPTNLTVLDNYVFDGCTSLAAITLPDTLTTLGQRAFNLCTSLTTMTLPDSLTTIGNRAFWSCTSLRNITIPGGITSLNTEVFRDCTSLSSVTFQDTLTTIGGTMFMGCISLTAIDLPNNLSTIGGGAFQDCTKLQSITIPAKVTSIGGSVFVNCISLNSVTFQGPLETIDMNLFSGCTSLTAIALPSGLKTIGSSAFSGCTGLTAITSWPTTPLTSIGTKAFAGTRLTGLTIPKETAVGFDAFENIEGFTLSCYGPSDAFSSAAISNRRCTDDSKRITVTLLNNDGVKRDDGFWITDGVLFYYDGPGGAVTVPEGVTKINKFVFDTNASTTDPTNRGMYMGTNPLADIILPTTLTEIGDYAFYGSGLSTVTIPKNVTTVGIYAFSSCADLATVTTNAENISFGDGAFRNCGNLKKFTSYANQLTFGTTTFQNCVKLTDVDLTGLTTLGGSTFSGCTSLSTIMLPEGVTSIGANAFNGCTSLGTITIPESVTSIGANVFYGCTLLSKVTIPEGVTSIGNTVFRNCSSLKGVTFLTSDAAFTSTTLNNFPVTATIFCKYGSTAATAAGEKSISYEYLSSTVSLTANTDAYTKTGLKAYSGFAERYGFEVSGASRAGETAVLDVLLAAHLDVYTTSFTAENYTQYFDVTEDGEVVKVFGTPVCNFSVTINGNPITGSVFETAVNDNDVIAVTYEQTEPTYSFTYKNHRIYVLTARPDIDYTIKLVDGTVPLEGMDVYVTAAGNVSNIFDESNKAGVTNADGIIPLKFKAEGAYKVAAKDADGTYAASYLDVTVESPDLGLGSLSLSGGVSDDLTELVSGYRPGSLVKKDVQEAAEGFDPSHYAYEYHVNSDAAAVALDLEVSAGYDGVAVGMQIDSNSRTPLESYSGIPVPLTGDTTTIKLYVTYTEDAVPYERQYTVEVIKSDATPYSWLLDFEATGRSLNYYMAPPPIISTSAKRVLHYQSDEYATIRIKVEAGNEVYLSGEKLTPALTGQTLDFTARLADVYDIRMRTRGTAAAQYTLTVKNGIKEVSGDVILQPRSLSEGVYTPDRVVEYKPAEGQFVTDNSSLLVNTTLWARASYLDYLSLGGHGGYVTFEYDEPIVNDPRNSYGIDFIIYGNAFAGGGAIEPGGVQVSSDGIAWYDLAGSNHYELEMLKDQPVTLKDGSQTTSLKLDSDTFYPRVYFGYADVSACSIYANADVEYYPDAKPANPYDNAAYKNIGDGFDLSWAVDGNGRPVRVDSIRYIRVQNIMDKSSGSLGENSTEICAVTRVNPRYVAQAPAGVTGEPEILVMNKALPMPTETLNDGQIKYYELNLGGGFPVVEVNGAENDNIFINTERFVGQGEYVGLPDASFSRTVRVIVQNGAKEPRIYVIKCTNCSDPAENADLVSIMLTPGDTKLSRDTEGNYTATVENNVQYVTFKVRALNPGAAIKLDGTAIMHGEATVPLPVNVGANSFELMITSTDGDNTQTYPIAITRKPAGTQSNSITVSFTFTGTTKHYIMNPEDKYLPGTPTGPYVILTWIPETRVTVPVGSTVKYVTDMMLMNAGINFHSEGGTYIDKVRIPGTNEYLGEFDNGPNSGWMYRHNGLIANVGYATRVLKNEDTVLWFYTDDYTKETDYEGPWNPSTPSAPASGSSPATLAPKVTASNGAAAVAISTSNMTAAIAEARKNNSAAIVIAPEITGMAKKVSVELPKASVSSIASETKAALTVETPVGSITIPNSALASIASQVTGGTVTLSLESVDHSALTPAQQSAVGSNPVYDISIMSGSSHIGSFGGGSITISLPYALKEDETAANVKVWYLNDAGELERITCTYDAATGKAIFTTSHLSYYIVGMEKTEEDFTISFTDVKAGDWFYEYVKYVVKKGLFMGTSTTTFSPDSPMTRAMLVTVLHRLEGLPAVTGTNGFTDVENGQWYTNAVIWANAGSIVGGYGSGLFGTNDNVTREQMVAILYRYASYKGYDVTAAADLSAYTDASDTSAWAQAAMKWATAKGLITGRTTATLAPGGSATRAEVAAVLQRFVEAFVKE